MVAGIAVSPKPLESSRCEHRLKNHCFRTAAGLNCRVGPEESHRTAGVPHPFPPTSLSGAVEVGVQSDRAGGAGVRVTLIVLNTGPKAIHITFITVYCCYCSILLGYCC